MMPPPTMDELKARYQRALLQTERAVRNNPRSYRCIKSLLRDITDNPLDVAHYHRTATRLATLLEGIGADQPTALFTYFRENIDPRAEGCARYFRVHCTDLRRQISDFDAWRARRRCIRLVR